MCFIMNPGLILYAEQHWGCLRGSRDSWSAHSWCQNEALNLPAPAPLNSSNVLTHLVHVFTGNEVTALERDHEHVFIMRPNWRELHGMARRCTEKQETQTHIEGKVQSLGVS